MTDPIQYPLDMTGKAPGNKITGESHGPCGPGNRAFVLDYGPFYAKSLVIRRADTNAILVNGVDYKVAQTFIEPTLQTGYLICSIITIEPPAYSKTLLCEYQVLGGDYSLSVPALDNVLDEINSTDKVVHWGEIIGKPQAYPPMPHLHDIYDTFGWEYVIAVLEAIRQAILQGSGDDSDDFYAYVDLKFLQAMNAINGVSDTLNAHINNYNNPHNVTKAQIGLGNVGNYPLATPEIARLNLSNSSLITPYSAKFANEYHTNDFENPHQVTATQVGLGNVDNYITATLMMALAGTDNESFLTPFGAAAMIAQALSETPPAPTTPPKASFSMSYTLNTAPTNSTTVTYSNPATAPATSTWACTATDTSTPGSSSITNKSWLITSDDDGSVNVSGSGNTQSFNVVIDKPAGGSGTSSTTSRTVKLTVTDANSLTNIKQTKITFTVALSATLPNVGTELRPPRIDSTLFEWRTSEDLPTGWDYPGSVPSPNSSTYKPYKSILNSSDGSVRTHTHTLDVDPFWLNWAGGDPATGMVKANHTVTWFGKIYYRESHAGSWTKNISETTGYFYELSEDVESGHKHAAYINIAVTNVNTALTSTTAVIVDMVTNPPPSDPIVDFELTSGESSLTVAHPNVIHLAFTDISTSGMDGVPLTQVLWQTQFQYGAMGGMAPWHTRVKSIGNYVPGETININVPINAISGEGVDAGAIERDGVADPYHLKVGSYGYGVKLTVQRATVGSPNYATASVTKYYSLVVTPASAAPPTANFTANYFIIGGKLTLKSTSTGVNPLVSWSWSVVFADGHTANLSGKTPAPYYHAVSSGSTIMITLVVTDSMGISASKTSSIIAF